MCGFIVLKDHHFRFIAEFTWEHAQDAEAAKKLLGIIQDVPKGIDKETFQGFYLTGQRTMLFFGQTDSAESLQRLCVEVSRDSAIKSKISLAVHVEEFVGILKEVLSKGA